MRILFTKNFAKNGKVNPMRHHDFGRLFFLAKIDPTKFGGRYHLVLAVQLQGIRKKDEYKTTKNISA